MAEPRSTRKRKNPGKHPDTGSTNAGGPARSPNWFQEWCAALLADPKAIEARERFTQRGKKLPATTVAMLQFVSERAHGKPPKRKKLSGEVAARIVRVPGKSPSTEAAASSAQASQLTAWRVEAERLTATRDGLRTRLDAEPNGATAWQLRRDIAATERAIAFAESKIQRTVTSKRHANPQVK